MKPARLPLNPFRYGKPVPPNCFVGRQNAMRTVFARIYNGESSALVGTPHIGKTSFLHYIRDDATRAEWLGDAAEHHLFVDLDCHLLATDYEPANFWEEVLGNLEAMLPDGNARRQIGVVRQSHYGSFTLKRLFDLLGRNGQRVVLLVDEFDLLLGHPNFNTAEFFGALRSLSVQTDGLALLTASRLSVAEMNRRSQAINPLGSPFFNNLIEVRLQPLENTEIDMLIEQSLDGTGVMFDNDDRAFLRRISGRHPFLVQIGAAALFEACARGLVQPESHLTAAQQLQHHATDHFNIEWRIYDQDTRTVLVALALAEHPRPDVPTLALSDTHDLELRWLVDGSIIEQESAGLAWNNATWRIAAQSFGEWLLDNEAWRTLDEPTRPLLDPQQAEMLRERVRIHERRLALLQQQQALHGTSTPPEITIEIQDLQQQIAATNRELQRLG